MTGSTVSCGGGGGWCTGVVVVFSAELEHAHSSVIAIIITARIEAPSLAHYFHASGLTE